VARGAAERREPVAHLRRREGQQGRYSGDVGHDADGRRRRAASQHEDEQSDPGGSGAAALKPGRSLEIIEDGRHIHLPLIPWRQRVCQL
jgi:hypothetical protein